MICVIRGNVGIAFAEIDILTDWFAFHMSTANRPRSKHDIVFLCTLHWRHNDHGGVSNHQPHGCLLNRLFRRRSKKTLKLRVTGLCVGNSPGPVNSPHKGPVTGKCVHLITSSWDRLAHWHPLFKVDLALPHALYYIVVSQYEIL